jgi:hypothetical protein
MPMEHHYPVASSAATRRRDLALRLRRLLVLPCLLIALLAIPASSQAYLTGFSEQQPSMFQNTLFTDLHTKIARYIAPWDFMSVPRDKATFEAWLAGAGIDRVKPLVSFYVSRQKPLKLPSATQYKRMIKAFRKAYPSVKEISPWNEANAVRPGRFANPTAKQAATFYKIVKQQCGGCRLVGLDVLDSQNVKATVKYIGQFQKALGNKGLPTIWGLHNYSDTNRFRNKGTKAVLAAVKGQVWLTETGGLVRFGSGFPYNEARAAKALKYMFKLASSNARLKRLYIYQWNGSPLDSTFDAGVIGVDGKPRPGYFVVKNKIAP